MGNFWGRKLLQISRFCGYLWKFSPRNLGVWCLLAWHKWAICESFLCESSRITCTHTLTHTHIHTHTRTYTHLTHPHPQVHVPEDIFLILCFPCSLEGGVLGPHWKRDPCVVQYLSAELCPPRALGLDIGLGQCTVASTMALQTVEIWSETMAGLDLQQPACSWEKGVVTACETGRSEWVLSCPPPTPSLDNHHFFFSSFFFFWLRQEFLSLH